MYPWQESYPPGLVLVAGEGWERDLVEDSILLVSVGPVLTPGSSSGHLVLVSLTVPLSSPLWSPPKVSVSFLPAVLPVLLLYYSLVLCLLGVQLLRKQNCWSLLPSLGR